MPNMQVYTIIHDVLEAEAEMSQSKSTFGKESTEYQTAEDKFKKLWRMLSMTRKPEEFLPVVGSTAKK